ncbi:Ribonuclease H-like superfamily [Sesbania bispinosa]|nr:Ribonuclease H-like superfamily [Sesbania bispinosa]
MGGPSSISYTWVKWNPPDIGWTKLNTNGSVHASSHRAACGGVFRNHHGNFLLAFAYPLPFVSVLEAELLAVLNGLELAWTRKYTQISVELDSASALRLIQFGCKNTHALFDTVRRIQQPVNLDWTVRFDHVFREANQLS